MYSTINRTACFLSRCIACISCNDALNAHYLSLGTTALVLVSSGWKMVRVQARGAMFRYNFEIDASLSDAVARELMGPAGT
jgi:hypothetical protein